MAPPYTTGKTYFTNDAKAWKATRPPAWTTAQMNTTFDTIWSGDAALRNYYNTLAVARPPTLPGFPAHMPALPQHPYLAIDRTAAIANRVVPPQRNAAGLVVAPALLGPGVAPVPAPVAPVIAPVAATAAPVAVTVPVTGAGGALLVTGGAGVGNPPGAVATPTPAYVYPFSFWPPQPWHPEPQGDRSLQYIMEELKTNNEKRSQWLITKPFMWPVTDEHNWENARRFGFGANGCVGLWCRIDANGNIDKRTVIKETRFTRSSWRDPLQWRQVQNANLPMEVQIHKIIDSHRPDNSLEGYNNLVKHDGYRLMMRQQRFRLYLEYYEGGNLDDAVRAYRRTGKHPLGPGNIPEYYLWRVFGNLIAACQILHLGQVDPAEGKRADWRPITHLDIKLNNIFLELGEHKSQIPEFVLADYGLSMFPLRQARDAQGGVQGHADFVSDNPIEYLVELDGYEFYAPEHIRTRHEPPDPLNQKTDIWQIGAVILELMMNGQEGADWGPKISRNGEIFPLCNFDTGRLEEGPNPWPPGTFPTVGHYSLQLRRIIMRCLNYSPDNRPTLVWLKSQINAWITANPPAKLKTPVSSGRDREFRMNQPMPSRQHRGR
ncbi:hypothetical protein HBI56_081400 [Parastagonospora nodorum]|uniref:Protein kinase domain-containing protein n=1 Tax=Phaeosphaeria nodorum (strain SN15 / ATCC MYA-4574 / FGSC 10173) TaxID=321614 RepID=A0A7U2I626_PHANO|nr:hypothetical protein HBH56_105290 [Parastagonospora nodorum]QRD04746.1 hypothetical protein JI435_106820 [Parastagonospora nodorum SN15]KAH3929169.1 hypothetical protein HBH54_125120 [Parastagonospora nodorum]KAH3951366.1 hypothetical protein HBH53_059120 [Parastagonospora nodorum]KAH3999237.1 hypothetical protein HBI10_121170 [Parastagonospora nodorum]